MSKNIVYLIVAIAVVATAGSYFVTKNSSETCVNIIARATSSAPVEEKLSAKVHGYPFGYYQDPLPLNCMSGYSAPSSSSLNITHLAYDFLIWLGVTTIVFLPYILYKWWQGPAMFGDNVRRG